MSRKRRYDEFLESMNSLFESGKHSDFVVVCGEKTYNVHKSIVCSQCDFFDAASRFGKEGEEGRVDLSDDDPKIVGYMMQHLYKLNYELPFPKEALRPSVHIQWDRGIYSRGIYSDKSPDWYREFDTLLASLDDEHNAKVVGVVQRYQPNNQASDNGVHVLESASSSDSSPIQRICALIFTPEFQEARTKPRERNDAIIHAKVYALAHKYNVQGLKETAMEKFEEAMQNNFTGPAFYKAVKVAYTTTHDTDLSLRDLVAAYVSKDLELYGLFDLVETALEKFPDLAYRVIRHKYTTPRESSTQGAREYISTNRSRR